MKASALAVRIRLIDGAGLAPKVMYCCASGSPAVSGGRVASAQPHRVVHQRRVHVDAVDVALELDELVGRQHLGDGLLRRPSGARR